VTRTIYLLKFRKQTLINNLSEHALLKVYFWYMKVLNSFMAQCLDRGTMFKCFQRAGRTYLSTRGSIPNTTINMLYAENQISNWMPAVHTYFTHCSSSGQTYCAINLFIHIQQSALHRRYYKGTGQDQWLRDITPKYGDGSLDWWKEYDVSVTRCSNVFKLGR
jgi:hypothetical protein